MPREIHTCTAICSRRAYSVSGDAVTDLNYADFILLPAKINRNISYIKQIRICFQNAQGISMITRYALVS